MCGIAGYYGTRQLPDEVLATCLTLMRRRGPDAARARRWTTDSGAQVLLLHSRLRIIDLQPRADQPLEFDRHWLAVNGELYDYLEQRSRLEAEGERFETTSDTEVLLRLLARKGWQALDDCEGMWAFAMFDEPRGRLSLGRDRFGEKPLYLYRDDTGLYFGSEPKFVRALLGQTLRVNRPQLLRFLVNGYKALYARDETFFEGLSELPAGSVLEVDADRRERLRRYWEPAIAVHDSMTWDEAVTGARDRLLRAVELRLRADVPLAFCMSGGVDSNTLIAIARRVFGYDVHGFTVVNEDARYDEWPQVQQAVADLGIRHTAVPVETTDFLGRLRRLIRYHDAPVYTISYYVHWLLMRQVQARGYRISVSGTGADELFSGYHDHQLMYLAEMAGEDGPGARARQRTATEDWLTHVRPVVRNPALQDPETFIRNPEQRDHIYLHADRFAEYLQRPWHEAFVERRYTEGLLRNRMLNELFHEAVPVILHEDDLNAMYHSIENRSPFLDRALFDFAQQIPTRHLVRRAAAKAVLREAMRGIVPDVILDQRRKYGFNAPVASFLDLDQPEVRRALLQDGPVFELVRRDRITALIERPDRASLPNSESKFLFNFVGVKLFLEGLEGPDARESEAPDDLHQPWPGAEVGPEAPLGESLP